MSGASGSTGGDPGAPEPAAPDSLLPSNATAFETAQSLTSARLLDAPVGVIRDARTGASAPAQLLGHLGWERSIHHPSADEWTQRLRIDSAFADHLSYGAPAALEEEIALDVGTPISIREFWEVPGGTWPDFYVCLPVGPGQPPPPDPDAVLQSALRRKNVRDWPIVRLEARETPHVVGVSVGSQVRLKIRTLPVDGVVRTPMAPFVGVGSILNLHIRTNPL